MKQCHKTTSTPVPASSTRFKRAGWLARFVCALAGAAALMLGAAAQAATLPITDGLLVWLKADAVNPGDSSQVRISGIDTYVKQWNDQSGGAHNASNTTDNDQPLYIASGLNGLPVLRFAQDNDDSGDRLYLGDLGLFTANAGSVFVVATINNDGRYNLFGNRNNDERWVADTWTESHPGSFRGERANGTFTPGVWYTTGSHIYALESSRSIYRMLIDGSEIGSDTPDYNSGVGQNWTIANRATDGQQLNGDIAEVIIFNHVLTAAEANQVGKYLADKYGVPSSYWDEATTPQAKIYDLGLPGNPGIINGTNIDITVPFRTDVTALAPTFMLSAGATCDRTSGATLNFSTPQLYTVTSSDLATTTAYLVTVHVRPPTIAYDFNNGLQGWTQIYPTLPAVLWANGALGSGHDADDPYTRFGRSPEFVLHGLEDLTYQLRGGPSPLPAPAAPSVIPANAINGGGFTGVALRDVATDTYMLWASRTGDGGDTWQTGRFTTNQLAPLVIPGKKYTLDYIDYNMGGWGWTYMDNVSIPGYGTRVELIANDPVISLGYGGNTTTVTLKIPEGFNLSTAITAYVTNGNTAALTVNGSSAPVVSVTFAAGGANSQTITVAGTAVADVLLRAGVVGLDTASLTINVVPPFIGQWVAGAANLNETSGFRSSGAHNGVAVGTPASLAFSTEVPPGCTGQSLDLRAGNVGVMVTNSSSTDGAYLNTYDDIIRNKFTIAFWAKGIPGGWNPWVSKRGEDGVGWQLRRMSGDPIAGFTMRGIANEDGWGSSINVNDGQWHHYAGVWDQATGTRKLYVDGVFSHAVNNTLGQMMNLASARHLVLGGRQQNNANFEGYFSGLLYDVRIYSYPMPQAQVGGLIVPAIKLATRSAVLVGGTATLTVSIPPGANASANVVVGLTNSQPARVNINGSANSVVTVTFLAGGGNSQAVTLSGISAGETTISAGAAGLAGASVVVQAYVAGPAGLIGHWVAGSAHLADISGYTPGTHDGTFVGGPPVDSFSSDVPLGKTGKSLNLSGPANIGVRINNSRTNDAGYLTTFDDGISTQFSVAFWSKGFPGGWNPWVSKYGESGRGWQLRRWGDNPFACFTIRGLANDDGTGSAVNVNDNNWHHFVGVWDGSVEGKRYLYIDGVLSLVLDNSFYPMSGAPGAHMALGARGDENDNYGNWFKGLLYDVRMYSSALGSGDVVDLVGSILVSPTSLSLVTPSDNTNFVTLTVPPSVVAAQAVTITVTSDAPGVAVAEGAVGGVRTITLPMGGANTTSFAVQANGPGTAHLTYTCPLLPALASTTVAVQQPNVNDQVAYWNFDNQTLEETSGFQPPGTHDGTAVGNVTFVPGRLGGYAADLRAANTAIRVKNSTISDAGYRSTFDAFLFGSPNGFTWTLWVKGLPTSDWSSWVAKDGEAAGYAVRKAWGQRVTFTLRNSGLPANANPSDDDPTDPNAVITDNLWHHLAAVYDPVAGQRRLYIDGVERINIADGGLTTPATGIPLCFGARDITTDPRFARVIVDEVRAYDKVLTPAEITAQVGAPLISITPNSWAPNLDDPDLTATVTVPPSMVATSAVNVTLTSSAPSVAIPVGATGGSKTIHFAMGGANTASVAIHAVGVGSATITGSSASSVVNGEIAVVVTPAATLIGHWLIGEPNLQEKSGYRPPGTHDGTAVGANAGLLTYSYDMPAGFTGQSLDLNVSNVAVQVRNSSWRDGSTYTNTFDEDIAAKFSVAFWAKGMPGEWGGWVTKSGEGAGWQLRRMGTDNIAGFTMRGIENEDGWGSGINVNNGNWHHYVGIWDQATGTRRLYVDGVFSHTVTSTPGQAMSLAGGAHLVFGGLQDNGGGYWNNRYVSCTLFDVRIYNSGISDYKIQSLLVPGAAPQPPLAIQPWSGGQIRIAWPITVTGFHLEQSGAVDAGWGYSGLSITVEGSDYVAYAPATGSAQFFRLAKD